MSVMYNSWRPSMVACTDMSEHGNQITTWLKINGQRVPYYDEFDVGGSHTAKILDALHLDYTDSKGLMLFTIPMQWNIVDTNHGCMMHAGCVASLVNSCGDAALRQLLAQFRRHTAASIEIHYLARERQYGTYAEVEAKVVRLAKELAVTNVEVRDKSSSIVLSRAVLSSHLDRAKPPTPSYIQNMAKHPWKFKVTYKTFKNSMGKSSKDADLFDLSGGHLVTDQKNLPPEQRLQLEIKIPTEREHVCPCCEIRAGDRDEMDRLERLGIARPSMNAFAMKQLARRSSKYCPNNNPIYNKATAIAIRKKPDGFGTLSRPSYGRIPFGTSEAAIRALQFAKHARASVKVQKWNW
ncbi:unnamed protein product [Calypogeia fissa]